MKFELPPLPYAKDALEPHLSARTVEFHYEKHHRGYLSKLEAALRGTPDADKSLEEIMTTAEGAVYNNAAQVWNHTFYWNSMRPDGGGEPSGELRVALEQAFGSVDAFREAFVQCATGLFGSGYVWLVANAQGGLELHGLKDADNPLLHGKTPLLATDVWEHAYYLDYQNDRKSYAERFLADLAHWAFAEDNLRKVRE